MLLNINYFDKYTEISAKTPQVRMRVCAYVYARACVCVRVGVYLYICMFFVWIGCNSLIVIGTKVDKNAYKTKMDCMGYFVTN